MTVEIFKVVIILPFLRLNLMTIMSFIYILGTRVNFDITFFTLRLIDIEMRHSFIQFEICPYP